MRLKKTKDAYGVLVNITHRESGSFTNSQGREIEYAEGDIVSIVPLESQKGELSKYVIAPNEAKRIYALTENVHWGALVHLILDNRKVVNLEVLEDLLAEYLEPEE